MIEGFDKSSLAFLRRFDVTTRKKRSWYLLLTRGPMAEFMRINLHPGSDLAANVQHDLVAFLETGHADRP
jgi:hypothetical protein